MMHMLVDNEELKTSRKGTQMNDVNANDTPSTKLMSGEELTRFIEHDSDYITVPKDPRQ